MKYDFVLGNDAGLLGVFDDAALRELYDLDYHSDHCLEFIDLDPGKYKVRMYAYDTYKGDVGVHVIIEVKDGSRGLVVGDPCYAFGDQSWVEIGEATDWFNMMELPNAIEIDDDYYDITEETIPLAVVSTGGDGEWDVTVMIQPYEEE